MPTTLPDTEPCHTGPAARTCAFDVALAELLAEVDTAELLAVTGGAA